MAKAATVERRTVSWSLSLIGVGLVVAGWLQLGLTFDGSFYLANMLERGHPYVSFQRYSAVLYEWPVVLAQKLGANVVALRHIYALSLAVLPLAALLMSWLVVRRRAPRLIIWPALGVCLVAAPALVAQVFESALVAEFAWPLLLLTLVALDGVTLLPALCLAAFLLLLAANSLVVFIVAACLALIRARVTRRRIRRLVAWAVLMLALAFVRYFVLHLDFAAHPISFALLRGMFGSVETGGAFFAVIGGWAAGALVAVRDMAPRRGGPTGARWRLAVDWLGLGAVVFAAVGLVMWSAAPQTWDSALDIRDVALLLELPLVALAAIDVLRPGLRRTGATARGTVGRGRAWLVAASAVAAATALVVTGIAWQSELDQLSRQVHASPTACVSVKHLGVLGQPDTGWWTGTLTILLQGRKLTNVVADSRACAVLRSGAAIPVGGVRVNQDNEPSFRLMIMWPAHGWYRMRRS